MNCAPTGSGSVSQALEDHPGLQWALDLFPGSSQEIVANTAYSLVVKITTNTEAIFYCKISPMEFSSEAEVLKLFETHQVPGAPRLFASHQGLHAVIQYDAGATSLEHECSGIFSAKSFEQVLDAYHPYQKCLVPSTLSLPQWSSQELFQKTMSFLSQDSEFFKSWHFSQEERKPLLALLPDINRALDLISSAPLALNHADFHDKNIVVGPSMLSIIDWSECVLAHPDFSKWAFFHKMRQKYSSNFDPHCLSVVERYLDFPAHASFVQALLPLYLAFNDWRLFQAVASKDSALSKKLQDRISTRMRELSGNMNLLLRSGQLH